MPTEIPWKLYLTRNDKSKETIKLANKIYHNAKATRRLEDNDFIRMLNITDNISGLNEDPVFQKLVAMSNQRTRHYYEIMTCILKYKCGLIKRTMDESTYNFLLKQKPENIIHYLIYGR